MTIVDRAKCEHDNNIALIILYSNIVVVRKPSIIIIIWLRMV